MCERIRTVLRAFGAGLIAVLLVTVLPSELAQAASSTAVATDFANVRAGPSTSSAVVGMLDPGDSFAVVGQVNGEEVTPGNRIWLKSSRGNFVYSGLTSASARSSPVARGGGAGRRIVVDRSAKIAQAIENGRVVYTARVTVGRPGWETPSGNFTILRRVANETMDSATIGIPRSSPGGYYLTNVLYTQYITNRGHSLHYNYWSSPSAFGRAAESRGCVGLQLADAKFFWDFASVGTPVTIR